MRKISMFRSRRRTMALHVCPDGSLVVRAPRFVGEGEIARFIREKSAWIEQAIQRTLDSRRHAEEWRAQFPQDDDFYKRQALDRFKERCAFYAAQMGVTYGKIGISNASSRWGSCSPNGRLRFQWRLVMAPPEVLDYVVVHELAHLKELNHSRRFWAVVEAILPDYRAAKKWLREHPILGRV